MGYPFRSRVKHDPNGNVVVLQMKDIDDADVVRVDEATKVHLDGGAGRHRVQSGDLLFRSRGRNNSAAMIPVGLGEAVLAAPMILIRAHGVLPAYLQWFINSQETQAKLAALAVGTSVMMISTDILKDLDVPVPSMIRQRQIAELGSLALREQALMAEITAKRKQLMDAVLMRAARDTR